MTRRFGAVWSAAFGALLFACGDGARDVSDELNQDGAEGASGFGMDGSPITGSGESGGATSGSNGTSASSGGSSATTGDAGSTGATATGGGMGASSSGGGSGSSGSTGNTGASAGGTSSGGTSTGGSSGATEPAPKLPTKTGTCPKFTNGTLTFSPGGTARTARVWIDEAAAASKDGPVVFYWHGTGSSPNEAQAGLGTGINTITALGGIVVAPVNKASGSFPWLQGGDMDFKLVDEVVACAQEVIGIDARHIHSVGMSAGGLFTSMLSYSRANLMASVAVYSGGGQGTFNDTSNKFSALVFYGGSGDNVFNYDFQASSKTYTDTLRKAGHFALLCDHSGGHTIPSAGPAAVTPFFLDHPFGAPSPYQAKLPATIPAYCKAQ